MGKRAPAGRPRWKGHLGTLGLSLDLDRLFFMGTHKPGTLTTSNAVVHLPMRSIQSYNGPPGSPAVRRPSASAPRQFREPDQ